MTKASEPTLRGDFFWTFLGNGIYAACQWAVLVLLAKTGSPELVGRYALAVAIATPVITFATFQLRSVQVTDIREQHSFGDYLGFRV
jgi:O-antigen/teichoic acid export membrane protein